jgi:ketosteroid isomerase-like protein
LRTLALERTDERGALLDLERRRCAAIEDGDVAALQLMLADDYVHVHMSGKIDDREEHLRAVERSPRKPIPGETLVRIYGDLAVVTGHLHNHLAGPDQVVNKTYCHRIAAKRDGQWRFVSVHLTPLAV